MSDELADRREANAKPVTPDQIRSMTADAHRRVVADLIDARKTRDRANERVKALVKEEADLRRVVNAMNRQPRTRKAKAKD